MAEGKGKEIGEHSPDAFMMEWTLKNLPNCKAFFACDVDLILRDTTGNIRLVELKRYAAKMPTHQKVTYQILDYLLKQADGQSVPIQIGNYKTFTKLKYHPFILLQFEKVDFNDKVFVNGKEQTEKEVIKLLSFKNNENED